MPPSKVPFIDKGEPRVKALGPLRLQSPGFADDDPAHFRREELPSRRARIPLPGPPPRGPPGRAGSGLPRTGSRARLRSPTPRLTAYRANPGSVTPLDSSRLLVDAARPLGEFLARLFGIENEWRRQAASAGPEAVLFRFRRDFLLRRAVKTKLPQDLERSTPPPSPPRPGRSSGTSSRAPLGRGSGARDRRDGRDGCSTSRPTSSRRSARRRNRRSRRRLARAARALAAPGGRLARPPTCPAPPASPTRSSWRSSTSSSSGMPSGAILSASTRRFARRITRAGSPSSCPKRSTTRISSRPSARTPLSPRSRVGPAETAPAPRGLRPDRPADDPPRGPRRDALLPPLPRPREGLLLEGILRRQDRPPGRRTRWASR